MRDPKSAELPARERALAGIASLLTEAPWLVDAEDLERLAATGISDEGVVQVVTIVAMFNHHTRVADGTGVEPDYTSPLARMQVDDARQPLPRPDPADWPAPLSSSRWPLSLRPRTAELLASLHAYVRTPSEALSARDRAVAGRAAAYALCDSEGVRRWEDAQPRNPREAALAAYAEKLTLTPWAMRREDLAPLRAGALDDRALLHVIALVGVQNLESRVRRVLGSP